MVIVTVTNGSWSKLFKVETAAGLLPEARIEFGDGTVTDPSGFTLTVESGPLEEGLYTWSAGGELTQDGAVLKEVHKL